MRFELDTEVNALYIYLRDIPAGGVAKTVQIQEGVNLDLDDQGRTLGIEFVDLEDFRRFLEDRGGVVDIPERAEDIPGLSIV